MYIRTGCTSVKSEFSFYEGVGNIEVKKLLIFQDDFYVIEQRS